MPVITYDKNDLMNLIGKKLDDQKLKEVIESIKPNVENIDSQSITVEHTADRIDLMPIEGLARAIKQFLGIKTKDVKVGKPKITVVNEGVPCRPYIACFLVKKVKLSNEMIKSLMQTQEILHETIGRKRKKAAIGLHDASKISPPIVYRAASREEKMQPLGSLGQMSLLEVLFETEKGKEYQDLVINAKRFPVFADKEGIFSFPPIINSERTRVTEKTSEIFVDITGTNRKTVEQIADILAYTFAERGFEIEAIKVKEKKRVDVYPKLEWKVVKIDRKKVERFLGISLTEKQLDKLLKKVGYRVAGEEVLVPPYRVDVMEDVDVYEDVAIAYGYDNFEPELPNLFTKGSFDEDIEFANDLKEILVGHGFIEVINPVMTNKEKQFKNMCLQDKKTIEISNPVSKEYTELRIWILPSLMEVLSKNTHQSYPQKIFEVGYVVEPDEKSEVKSRTLRHVAAAEASSDASFAKIKAIAFDVLKKMNLTFELKEAEHPSFIKGRCASINVKGKIIGYLGEIHPLVLENWKIEIPVAAFEVELPTKKLA